RPADRKKPERKGRLGSDGGQASCLITSCSTRTLLGRCGTAVVGLAVRSGSRQRALRDRAEQLVSSREKLGLQARASTTPANRQGLLALKRGEGHGRSFLVHRPNWTMEGRAARPDDSPAHTQAEGGPWVWLSEQLYPGLPDCRRGALAAAGQPVYEAIH